MAAGSPQSLRKALKTVGLAKANGDFKALDVAIAKATSHDEALPKEKHVLTILKAVSALRPRAEAAYCIHGLARRLSKTHNWKVALKTVIIVHRALREVDDTFCDAVVKYSWSRGHLLNLSHVWDGSSSSALDFSAWVRTYASYLEERLECFRVLKYDVQKDHSRTKELDTPDLLRQLPALQQLLSRLLDCQPKEGTVCNCLIQFALSMVAGESAKLYAAITDGNVNLLDKFFEMQHDDAVRALEIYKKSRSQEERLCEFFEICRSFNFGRALKFIKIQQPPASFLTTMEDYANDVPSSSTLQHMQINEEEDAALQGIHLVEGDLLIDHKQDDNVEEKSNANGTAPDQSEAAGTSQVIDLLSFDELPPVTSESNEQNSLALAIVQSDSKPDGLNSISSESSWELALFTAPSSNADAVSAPSSNVASAEETKVAVGLDRLTLDSLYDGAMASTPNQNGFYHRQAPSNPFDDAPISPYQLVPLPPNNMQMAMMPQQHVQGQVPFYGLYSNAIPTAPTNSQMPFVTQQEAFMMQQQQLANVSNIPSNSSGNPFAIEQSYSQLPPNSFNGFI
ncbi:putative clathrin assembly protein At5g35200 [Prunus avium]|uniref:Clathrin assembly protein At5g35200 n=1 Tax=Prunus avium TaxID=42229 RepID=A0A6P5SRS8_PRUAV|nr:putative clathrin assembly protein At5g35200 [Prunus avium]XP_021818870.1 putative clathrin assembly protein At5g35200 [Prunus avium]XP_021818871.1 putative clathrin assembly protein At5g35200 [Prunus avium]XP_021818872.1 putative clathrin assembly protein At5g35200 [Prunus avium]